ncbi:MAG: esterase family protein [Pelagimonas sp.]|jgi:pimeloyl-ACP methyl ester carboxylesterase|nr:esterase family protein [Pelagimonas sp.]
MSQSPDSDGPDSEELGGPPGWFKDIFPAGPFDGFYHKQGMHALVHVARASSVLVVSFDNLAEAGGRRYDRDAWAAKFISDNGWSHLGIFAEGPTWFREEKLIRHMEMLRDSGFFRRFDKVVLCGTSMGGFGALTFSSLIPGCSVIAFSPQTTLNRKLVPWERRFVKGRRQDWTLPYSDAADQIQGAARIYLVYDPFDQNDRAQVARLRGDNILHLPARGVGHKSALVMRRMKQLKPIMLAAVNGSLTRQSFDEMIEARKEIYLYKKTMTEYLEKRNKPRMAEHLARAFKARRKALKEAETRS